MTPQSPNKLLAALPKKEYARLLPQLRTVRLANDAVLPHCGETRVYFLGTGVCSITNSMADGALIEIASVGSEGLVGLTSLTGEAPHRRHRFLHVSEGTAQWMPLLVFEHELVREGPLRELVERFCRVFLESMIQAVACNRLHSLHERCARWLLTTHDRLGRARFEMGSRTLARVLGVKPTELEAVVMKFEQLGLIKRDDRTFTVFDALGLRRLACPCYRALKRGYSEPLPADDQKPGKPSPSPPARPAKILSMRPPGDTTCMLCGCTLRVPHKSTYECILALDTEIASLFVRAKSLRKIRKDLLSRRLAMYRNVLKNAGSFA
jgi:Crp-like helix-turn-helix domain